MTITVVSSCSLKGWAEYGERFVTSFNEHWPKDVALYFVSEDAFDFNANGGREVHVLSLWDYGPARRFLTKYQDSKAVHGDAAAPRPSNCTPRWRGNSGYNFRYDAYKFSKKVFAIGQVMWRVKRGKLFWIDADVVTFAPVPTTLFERVLPKEAAISHLARPRYHSECGFVGYNLDNSDTPDFIRTFVSLYEKGDVFALDEWHDSWVFDWLLAATAVPHFAIPTRTSGHPFINSELGMFMDHLKGKRKGLGRSNPNECLHRGIGYWNR